MGSAGLSPSAKTGNVYLDIFFLKKGFKRSPSNRGVSDAATPAEYLWVPNTETVDSVTWTWHVCCDSKSNTNASVFENLQLPLFFFGTELSFTVSCFTMAISLIFVCFIEHVLCRTQPLSLCSESSTSTVSDLFYHAHMEQVLFWFGIVLSSAVCRQPISGTYCFSTTSMIGMFLLGNVWKNDSPGPFYPWEGCLQEQPVRPWFDFCDFLNCMCRSANLPGQLCDFLGNGVLGTSADFSFCQEEGIEMYTNKASLFGSFLWMKAIEWVKNQLYYYLRSL